MADHKKPIIALAPGFEFGAVDGIKRAAAHHLAVLTGAAPMPPGVAGPIDDLGPLAPMVGSWHGHGFNTIFRPQSPESPTPLPIPAPGDNVLELNLTEENITFTRIDGAIPNRGMVQKDIALFGMTYLQQISDVTTQTPVGIHIEPGLWIIVPSTSSPDEGQTVARMASIPHGTTINAQGTARTFNGPPTIPEALITPKGIGGGNVPAFDSQTATNQGTARIPQDLTSFIQAGTITQEMIHDPNVVLRNAIAGQTITETTEINIATEGLIAPPSGGTANIAFLVNGGELVEGQPNGPNANAVKMTATFWIETVMTKVLIPPHRLGHPPVRISLHPVSPGGAIKHLVVDPGRNVSKPTVVTTPVTQIQYTQTVFLNFNDLSWPHVSVATLIPSGTLPIPPDAFN